jgi:hypothetical protein
MRPPAIRASLHRHLSLDKPSRPDAWGALRDVAGWQHARLPMITSESIEQARGISASQQAAVRPAKDPQSSHAMSLCVVRRPAAGPDMCKCHGRGVDGGALFGGDAREQPHSCVHRAWLLCRAECCALGLARQLYLVVAAGRAFRCRVTERERIVAGALRLAGRFDVVVDATGAEPRRLVNSVSRQAAGSICSKLAVSSAVVCEG